MSIIKILQENKEYEFVCERDFECSFNKKLTSLKGSPKYVGKDFWCMRSKIETLDGAPKYVGKSFFCGGNDLKTLEGAPEYVGNDFYCRGNPILPKEEIIKYHASGAVKGKIYSDHGVFK